MIQTLMALWNWGASGRLLVMMVTFFCVCISISLLFVTVGSIWGPLLSHGRPGGETRPVSKAVLITATAPTVIATATATAPVEVTPTLPPNLCLASPTGARGNTARVDGTRDNGRGSVPSKTAISSPLHKKPTPDATVPPEPSPTLSPTLPAVTPTIPITPTVTTQPTAIPTATDTPGITPTATLTPTDTSTPGVTPTPTITGTDTPTATVTGTTMDTPTATVTGTAPDGSPTVVVSVTEGIAGRQVHDGRPQNPGTPSDTNNGQTGQGNCLGDTLVTGGEASLLSRLQEFIWMILVSSLLGTILFCAQMYRLSRNTHR